MEAMCAALASLRRIASAYVQTDATCLQATNRSVRSGTSRAQCALFLQIPHDTAYRIPTAARSRDVAPSVGGTIEVNPRALAARTALQSSHHSHPACGRLPPQTW